VETGTCPVNHTCEWQIWQGRDFNFSEPAHEYYASCLTSYESTSLSKQRNRDFRVWHHWWILWKNSCVSLCIYSSPAVWVKDVLFDACFKSTRSLHHRLRHLIVSTLSTPFRPLRKGFSNWHFNWKNKLSSLLMEKFPTQKQHQEFFDTLTTNANHPPHVPCVCWGLWSVHRQRIGKSYHAARNMRSPSPLGKRWPCSLPNPLSYICPGRCSSRRLPWQRATVTTSTYDHGTPTTDKLSWMYDRHEKPLQSCSWDSAQECVHRP